MQTTIIYITYHIHPVEVINELGHFCWQYMTAFLIQTSRSPSPMVNYFLQWHTCTGIIDVLSSAKLVHFLRIVKSIIEGKKASLSTHP